jgi:hypothetical protein
LSFAGQVVLVHGDTHRSASTSRLTIRRRARPIKLHRVETHGSPSFGWTKATVDPRNPTAVSLRAANRCQAKCFNRMQTHA